jgi:hypothetical protein
MNEKSGTRIKCFSTKKEYQGKGKELSHTEGFSPYKLRF